MGKTAYKVATVDELVENGNSIICTVEGLEIAVFRIDDEFYGLANYCVHQGGPLCEGELTGKLTLGDDVWDLRYEREGEVVSCPWHRWKFDVKTGVGVDDDRYAVPSFETDVRDGDIYVLK